METGAGGVEIIPGDRGNISAPGANSERKASHLLVERCAAGEDAAWEELLAQHGGLLHEIAKRYSSGDAAQTKELFIYIIEGLWERGAQRLAAWDGSARLSTYLAAVASRLCLDCGRKPFQRERRRSGPLPRNEAGLEEYGDTGRRCILRGECARIMGELLEELPGRDRAVLELFYRQDMSYTEIGQVLGIGTQDVGARLLRARERLRKLLAGKGIKNIRDLL